MPCGCCQASFGWLCTGIKVRMPLKCDNYHRELVTVSTVGKPRDNTPANPPPPTLLPSLSLRAPQRKGRVGEERGESGRREGRVGEKGGRLGRRGGGEVEGGEF